MSVHYGWEAREGDSAIETFFRREVWRQDRDWAIAKVFLVIFVFVLIWVFKTEINLSEFFSFFTTYLT